jgi:hypothetical protein
MQQGHAAVSWAVTCRRVPGSRTYCILSPAVKTQQVLSPLLAAGEAAGARLHFCWLPEHAQQRTEHKAAARVTVRKARRQGCVGSPHLLATPCPKTADIPAVSPCACARALRAHAALLHSLHGSSRSQH